jgi:hypothetical protein
MVNKAPNVFQVPNRNTIASASTDHLLPNVLLNTIWDVRLASREAFPAVKEQSAKSQDTPQDSA